MATALSETGPERRERGPLYLQVARTLREGIVGGEYPVGAQLPGEDALSARFAVSRYTIREALRRLREEGLVSSRQGAGTVVVPPASGGEYVHRVMSVNDLVAVVAGTRLAIDSLAVVRLDRRLAARTGLAAGQDWLQVRGIRRTVEGDAPVCASEYYINRAFAAVGRMLQRHNGPIFPLIEDMFGESIAEVHQEITATLVDAPLAEVLGVEPASAALQMRRTYRTQQDLVAQVTINTHPAARFSHAMTMRRLKA
jgi:GntR family transcriptional regulator